MRTIGCFFMFVWVFLGGCVLEDGPLPSTVDAGLTADASQLPPILVLDCVSDPSPPDPTPVATWPRSHPSGTLLVDHVGDLWMVADHGIRMQVSGDDTLGEIGLDEHDATMMTLEEERCLTPSLDYWGPPNYSWQPVYGPDEADRGPFVIDWAHNTRHRTSIEALDSYGYYTRWIDGFDSPGDAWSLLAEGDPVGIRDGTIVHTQHGFYYVVHGRSFWFNPPDLVAEAGYHPENALWMLDSRLREIAPASTSFEHETFDICPADERSTP
ncbi:hypothetical protein K8R04_04635 [Candidatus Uhrbacteria bacterium]|nr:hypothetical protein [Candidatus Uhrbacteria bacterium]